MNTDLFPSNEIVGAIAGSIASAEDIAIFAKDPKAILSSKLNIQTEGSFSIVENSADTIHLALPYYSGIETAQAQVLEDESIEHVSGGEILISVGVVSGILIGSLAAGTSMIAVGAFVGGTIGTIAVAGITIGAVAGAKKNGK